MCPVHTWRSGLEDLPKVQTNPRGVPCSPSCRVAQPYHLRTVQDVKRTLSISTGIILVVSILGVSGYALNLEQEPSGTAGGGMATKNEPDKKEGDELGRTGLVPHLNTGKIGDPYQFAKTAGAIKIYEYLRECYPKDRSGDGDIWAQTPCFNERVLELAASAEPADFFAGAKAVVVERPDVFAVCHDAGHKGSDVMLRRYWDQNAPVLEQQEQLRKIFSVVNDTCMSGFIHGLFDTLGYLKADIGEFKIALEACLIVLEFDCSDGLGHAAWEATLDLGEATKLCTLLPTNEGRVICDGGIVMRIYQHLEKTDPWYYGSVDTPGFVVKEWMEKVASLCDDWPEDLLRDRGSKEGCWVGTPYLYFKPLYSELSSRGNDFQSSRKSLIQGLRLMSEACESFGSVGAEACYGAWDQYLVRTALYDAENIKVLCGALPNERATRCEARSLAHLEDELRRNQAAG